MYHWYDPEVVNGVGREQFSIHITPSRISTKSPCPATKRRPKSPQISTMPLSASFPTSTFTHTCDNTNPYNIFAMSSNHQIMPIRKSVVNTNETNRQVVFISPPNSLLKSFPDPALPIYLRDPTACYCRRLMAVNIDSIAPL